MTFLADVAAAPPPADVIHTYRMPDSPRLVEPAPVQDPALTKDANGGYTLTFCEPCGAALPPGAASCRLCLADTAAFVASAPRDELGQLLPAIHFDYRGAR